MGRCQRVVGRKVELHLEDQPVVHLCPAGGGGARQHGRRMPSTNELAPTVLGAPVIVPDHLNRLSPSGNAWIPGGGDSYDRDVGSAHVRRRKAEAEARTIIVRSSDCRLDQPTPAHRPTRAADSPAVSPRGDTLTPRPPHAPLRHRRALALAGALARPALARCRPRRTRPGHVLAHGYAPTLLLPQAPHAVSQANRAARRKRCRSARTL
jgi:hypothetical protein